MAILCPACGEQILSIKFGYCPGCHAGLPPSLKLSPEKAEPLMRNIKKPEEHPWAPPIQEAAPREIQEVSLIVVAEEEMRAVIEHPGKSLSVFPLILGASECNEEPTGHITRFRLWFLCVAQDDI